MSALKTSSRVVRRRLDVCEHEAEEWQVAHQAVQHCRRFESWLIRAIELFRFIHVLDDVWRDDVFRGVTPFQEEDFQTINGLYQRWLHLYAIGEPLLLHF